MTIEKKAQLDIDYRDVQAAVGITKHIGGFATTDELLALCHIAEAQEVLYVGCGIGVGPAYIATAICRNLWATSRPKHLTTLNKREKYPYVCFK